MQNFVWYLGLAVASSLQVSVAYGFQVEVQLLRSSEVPGFFAVTVQPPENGEAMFIQDIYVLHFDPKESQLYEPLFSMIESQGGLLVERDRINEYATAKYNRIIYLGLNEKAPKARQFVAADPETVERDFLLFRREELGPVYMQDLVLSHGGNISEVYPRRHDFLTDQAVTFVGKFEAPMKTRVTVQAVTSAGLVETDFPLDLGNEGLIAKRNNLAEYWDEVRIWDERTEIPSDGKWKDQWQSYFPYILALVGGGLVFVGLFMFRNKRDEDELMELLNEEGRF